MSSSKSMLLRVVLCLEILLLVAAHEPKQKYCGAYLTEQLQFLCRGRYAYRGPAYNAKTSGDSEDYAYINDEPLAESSPFSYQLMPFLANFRSAASLRPRVRRNPWYLKRGVADECCSKPCTKEELRSYCF